MSAAFVPGRILRSGLSTNGTDALLTAVGVVKEGD
jgi:hypothetical protein